MIVEGRVESYQEGELGFVPVGQTWDVPLSDLLEGFDGKRIRIIIEELD
jgi:hypothetical protein